MFTHTFEVNNNIKNIPLSPYSIPGIINSKIIVAKKDILYAVCLFFEINEKKLNLKSRKKDVIFERFIAMYLLRTESKLKFMEISEIFKKHHATVIHACETIKNFISINDEKTIYSLNEISKLIKYIK